ncbi:hypothetical protein NLJ89_g5020 [Agrocybe chaxingu]|uniref:Uncharacterized protein n=1 Tax=Agrocybe chaxingu TaxID=84603 RepID=A0A9W8JZC8_9AGAR|nr:hypothetical protein NLJ89_g5020 [Agrocybe chaxingu]
MPPYTDFVLPGLQNNPGATLSILLNLAFSYHPIYNSRRLEHYSYGAWDEILNALIEDLKGDGILKFPQFCSYYKRSGQTDQRVTTITAPASRTVSCYPDFAIVATNFTDTRQDMTSLEDYTKVILKNVTPFMFIELKKIPSRSYATQADFEHDLRSRIIIAKNQAIVQAAITLKDGAHFACTELLLVVASGEWWAFKLVASKDPEVVEAMKQLEIKYTDADNFGRKEKKRKKAEAKPKFAEDLVKPLRYLTLREGYSRAVQSETGLFPKGKIWSGLLRFGTEASNQRFYGLHDKIKKMMSELPEVATGNVDYKAADPSTLILLDSLRAIAAIPGVLLLRIHRDRAEIRTKEPRLRIASRNGVLLVIEHPNLMLRFQPEYTLARCMVDTQIEVLDGAELERLEAKEVTVAVLEANSGVVAGVREHEDTAGELEIVAVATSNNDHL